MNNIPIFDSLTHPTINGDWLRSQDSGRNTIDCLLRDMKEENIKWAFAVGMSKIGGYNSSLYSELIRSKTDILYPIAYFDFERVSTKTDIEDYIIKLKKLNYAGIKIHPRFSNVYLDNPYLSEIIKTANKFNMLVMICTYFYEAKSKNHKNNLGNLNKLLYKVKDEKIILLHSYGTRLIEMMEIAHVYKNILLDLSFTFCRYEGSSIDFDIKFLFNNFSSRICIGSDNPEYSEKKLRERFEAFSVGVKNENLENIAYKNIQRFIS